MQWFTSISKKKAVKANYMNHGLAFRFPSLEPHEGRKSGEMVWI